MARKAYNLEMAMEKPEEVEELYISGLNLTEIPKKIFHLKNLKKLDFSENSLDEIPEELAKLQNIEEFNFFKNRLTASSFKFLTKQNFPSLKIINLCRNKITRLPLHFFQFDKVTHLNISLNQIAEIPSEISQLKNLISLAANNNLITSLSSEISQLKNLNHLKLHQNKLELLPNNFTDLANLNELTLFDNPLKKLPTDFAKINTLTYLRFSITKDFPTEYFHEQLRHVKKLWLIGDEKIAVPNSVFQIHNLEDLLLMNFGASRIHPSIGQLQKLRWLRINRINIKSLPASIGNLSLLEEFLILYSNIKRLPSSIVNLQKLRKFRISNRSKYNNSKINRFLKKIKHETFPTYLKEAAFNFIFSKENSLDNLSKKDLLILAQFPFQNLGKATENLLYQKHSLDILKNPFDTHTHFTLLGETNLKIKKLQPHLKNISKKITPQTTHVVLGKLPGEIENLASRDFVFVRESELNLWIQQQENPYLLSSSEAEVENLSRLLLSCQNKNIDLALQIMETGGVPEILLTDLVIVFKKLSNSKQKRAIRKLLSLHLSEAALRVVSLKTGLLKAKDLEKKILELTDETVLDGMKISKYLTPDKK